MRHIHLKNQTSAQSSIPIAGYNQANFEAVLNKKMEFALPAFCDDESIESYAVTVVVDLQDPS